MLQKTQTEATLKFLNEVFVFDEVWQESVKAFTISLFLSELSQNDSGVNVVNFKEDQFFQSV